ncbi:hypothetical protein CA85_52760 [Allorhodopirellula solitaria]|uniref:Uncharacterized protein n=2 Tax=Allorhodopirellula solitaria TaxID=2527987 RepID=A0A5C5WGY0_9BACT|nr:hypothetical protein CA85_52760 [Allorhodopirellula solitaria]
MAEALAKKWNGKLIDNPIKLDGEPAYRVKGKPNPSRVQPIDCIVVVTDGRVVMLMAGAQHVGTVDEALTQLAASWKWKKRNESIDELKSR